MSRSEILANFHSKPIFFLKYLLILITYVWLFWLLLSMWTMCFPWCPRMPIEGARPGFGEIDIKCSYHPGTCFILLDFITCIFLLFFDNIVLIWFCCNSHFFVFLIFWNIFFCHKVHPYESFSYVHFPQLSASLLFPDSLLFCFFSENSLPLGEDSKNDKTRDKPR